MDLKLYLEMVRLRRPSRTKTEQTFIQRYITPTGAEPDSVGNYFLRIGAAPILWSSHTDTVHVVGGQQIVEIVGDYIQLSPKEPISNCLGADCTTGVWIMLEMIKARVEGLYIFHRDEEIGGKGSRFIAKKTPKLLEGIKCAIAFDRFGKTSVITQQMGDKCASQDFVDSITTFLPGSFIADNGGSFTDTANYTDIISECSNLSVGYYNQHTKLESQSISHLFALKDAMVRIDPYSLVASRSLDDKGDQGWRRYFFGGKEYSFPEKDTLIAEEVDDDNRYIRSTSMSELVRLYPNEIADILETNGYSPWDLLQEIQGMYSR